MVVHYNLNLEILRITVINDSLFLQSFILIQYIMYIEFTDGVK